MKIYFTSKRAFVCLLLSTFTILPSNAQGTWTFAAPSDGAGSTGPESGRAICVDASGNTYVTGVFNGAGVATDFDLNSSFNNVFTATSNDGYIASYDKNGNFRWKTIVTGASSDFLAPSGGICTNGTFVWVAGAANVTVGAAQIMSSTNTVTITTSGTGTDAFVAKMNCSNGSVIWQQAFGGTGANDYAMGICTDPSGCCYVSGSYSSAFTLGSISAPTPGGASDFFIAKFSASGIMTRFNSGGSTANTDMVNAGGGLIYVPGAAPVIIATGQTGASTANFGPFTGLTNSGLNDAFLVELDSTLTNFTNALVFGSAGSDELLSAVYDPFTGGVFVSGFCSGNITFPGTAALTGIGGQDIVMARYNPATNLFVWSNIMGGTGNDRGWCVTADTYGGILLSGYTASAPCNFGGSVSIPTNAGLNDLFVTRFTPAGAPVWVLTAAGAGSEEARSICSWVETTPAYQQNLFITGITNTTGVSFGSFPVGCDGGNDFFLAKLTDATFSPPLSATQSQVNLTCNGVCNGSATVVASGGTAPYTYSWSPSGGSGATASSLCATIYTCTITDATSSAITKTFSITQPSAIVLNANSQTNVSCFGGANGAASVVPATGGAGGFTYNWTPGNPTGDGTVSVTGLTAGTWTCTVTDANSCTATRTFNITSPSAIVVTPAAQTNVSCFGGTNGAASINTPTGGAGGYTYNWTPGNPTGDGTVSVTGLTAGSWTCTVTDANSCVATQTFNITAPTALVVTPATQTNVSCFGGSNGAASVTASGGAGGNTYNWTPGNPTGDGTAAVTGLTAGSWTCTVTNVNSCVATQTFNITAPTAIVVTPAAQTNISCFGGANGAAQINTPTGGAGGFTYNWTPGNPTGDGTVSVTGLTAGSWTCTVTDANSCVATQTFNITAPSAIVVTPAAQTNISCNGGSNGAAFINTPTGGAGGFTYNWTPGNPTGDGTVSVSGLTAGTWTCTVTDANSCVATQTFNITAPTAITASISSTSTSCTANTGTATVSSVTGGAGGYTYSWAPTGGTAATATNLAAATYTCTITDANGCQITRTVTVTTTSGPSLTAASQTNIACNGGATGAASVNAATGGTSPYSYNWTPGNPTGDGTVSVTGLTAGTWTCTVTDAGGCNAIVTFNITAPSAIVVTPAAQTNVACNGGATGAASINTPTGGAGGFTYNWTPGNPTGDGTVAVTGLTAGTWTCTVTDANSCVASQTFNITAPFAIVVTPAAQTNVSCNGGANGAASINTPTGGAGGYSYNWTPGNPTGDGTFSVTGLTAGSWTCTVTDANSCVATQTFNITAPSAIVVTPAAQTNVACNGGATGAASINTPTGGAGGFTYNWTPGNPTGDGTVSVSGLTAGTWTCTVTDANACVATQTFNITAPTAITASISSTSTSCTANTGTATVSSVTGGAGGYTYLWSPSGGTASTATNLAAATYTCTITDANGCQITRTVTVTTTSGPSLTAASQTNIACNGGATGAASVNAATGGTSPYSYNWTPGNPTGDGTVSVSGLTAGTWTCTVTDAGGCNAIVTFNITAPSAIVVTSASQTNISCNGGSNGAASINTPTGGAGGYTYNWTPGNPTGDGTVSVSGLTSGTWTCTVTDANSCNTTVTFNITSPSAVSPVITVTNVTCFGGNTGVGFCGVIGGTLPYTYSWAPIGGTGATASNLPAGCYTCTVTDANGCTGAGTVCITSPSAITVTPASQTNVTCNGGATGAASINTPTGGAGGYTYNWTPGNPTGDGTVSVTGLTAGTWTCIVTDANGCTATQTFNITAPPALVASAASQTNVSCFSGANGAATVTVSGGSIPYSYNWTPGNPTGDGTASVTGLTAGTWTCTVTDANSCVTTQTFNITQPAALVASASSQTNISCNGGTNGAATVSVTGGTIAYAYNWTPGNPTGDGTSAVTGLIAGTWTCTVTDANSCVTTQTFNITQPTPLVANAVSQTNISCNGGSNGAATVAVTGGTASYSYNWTPGNPTGDGTASVSGLTAGTWTCTVTDANSCVATRTFLITQPNALVATASSQTNVSCNTGANGAAAVSVSGGTTTYSYNWTPGNPTGDGTASVSGLTAGTWTCTVTDANSCVTTQTFNITQPIALSVSGTSTNVSCNAGNNGSASVNLIGGTTPYSYTWSPTGGTASTATGLSAGTYSCLMTDANGCTITYTVNITEPVAIAVTDSIVDVTCNGLTNGSATVFTSGGNTPYSFIWSPSGGNSATASGLGAGLYSCTITDALGCTFTQTVTINEPSVLTATSNATTISCNGGTSTVTVSGGGGTAPYSGTGTFTVTAGTYTYTVTDANGCSSVTSVTVTQPGALSSSSVATSVISCNGGTTTVTVSASGGTTPYSGTGTFTVSAGTYSYTVTDANGCTSTSTITITEPSALTSASSATSVLCNGDSATITVTASGGVAPYTGTGSFTVLAGTYSYTIADVNGCSSVTSVTISEPTAISTTVASTNVLCNGGNNGSIDLTVTGGTGPYTFDWNNGTYTTEDLSGLVAGTYVGVLTDANGCTDGGTIIITEPSLLVANVSVSNNPGSCGATDGSIDISVSGGTLGYTFLWNTTATSEDLSGLGAGAYSCVVTDSNGCSASVNTVLNDPNAPTVTLSIPTDTACSIDPAFVLSGELPAGGTFSGTGVVSGSFDPALAGVGVHVITYTFTDSSGCTGIATDTISVDVCTGTIASNVKPEVSIFPNPNNGSFTVLCDAASTISIYDVTGNVIYDQKTTSARTEINLTCFAEGVYVVKVGNAGSVTTQKIILTK